jgi:putative FmdB family regulatory protein
MPIYEYLCQDCGAKFEKLVVKASDASGVTCPTCGKAHVSQQLSTFAAHTKGGGSSNPPMCPSGGVCPTPGACGLN